MKPLVLCDSKLLAVLSIMTYAFIRCYFPLNGKAFLLLSPRPSPIFLDEPFPRMFSEHIPFLQMTTFPHPPPARSCLPTISPPQCGLPKQSTLPPPYPNPPLTQNLPVSTPLGPPLHPPSSFPTFDC